MANINLTKRGENVKIQLAKHNLREKVVLRVGTALDKSGSAQPFYLNGQMQEIVDRLLGVSYNFDDNGEVDTWIFHNDSRELPAASASSYGSYVNKEIMGVKRNADWWGGTSYAPVMRNIVDFYFPVAGKTSAPAPVAEKSKGLFGSLFGKKEEAPVPAPAPVAASDASKIPALVFFITDGVNDDKRQTEQVIRDSQDKDIYWMMVGIGDPDDFTFIEEMGDKYPNVGFVHFNNLDIDDEDMYDAILDGELTEWIKSRK